MTLIKGDLKAPFSIATTPRCRGGRYPFDPYLIMLSVQQGGIKHHFWVFGMTRPGIKLRFRGPLANTLLNGPFFFGGGRYHLTTAIYRFLYSPSKNAEPIVVTVMFCCRKLALSNGIIVLFVYDVVFMEIDGRYLFWSNLLTTAMYWFLYRLSKNA